MLQLKKPLDHSEVVQWWRLVWFKGHVPRQAFISSMACQGKLLTEEKLKLWGCINDDSLVLCGAATEEVTHLFFSL